MKIVRVGISPWLQKQLDYQDLRNSFFKKATLLTIIFRKCTFLKGERDLPIYCRRKSNWFVTKRNFLGYPKWICYSHLWTIFRKINLTFYQCLNYPIAVPIYQDNTFQHSQLYEYTRDNRSIFLFNSALTTIIEFSTIKKLQRIYFSHSTCLKHL